MLFCGFLYIMYIVLYLFILSFIFYSFHILIYASNQHVLYTENQNLRIGHSSGRTLIYDSYQYFRIPILIPQFKIQDPAAAAARFEFLQLPATNIYIWFVSILYIYIYIVIFHLYFINILLFDLLGCNFVVHIFQHVL